MWFGEVKDLVCLGERNSPLQKYPVWLLLHHRAKTERKCESFIFRQLIAMPPIHIRQGGKIPDLFHLQMVKISLINTFYSLFFLHHILFLFFNENLSFPFSFHVDLNFLLSHGISFSLKHCIPFQSFDIYED